MTCAQIKCPLKTWLRKADWIVLRYCHVPLFATLWTEACQAPLSMGFPMRLRAGIMEWVAISFSSGYSRPRDRTCVSFITGGFFTAEPPSKCRRLSNFYQNQNKYIEKGGIVLHYFANLFKVWFNRSHVVSGKLDYIVMKEWEWKRQITSKYDYENSFTLWIPWKTLRNPQGSLNHYCRSPCLAD